jgi:TRAP-type C4-dicarboxylate transport system permease small subunit
MGNPVNTVSETLGSMYDLAESVMTNMGQFGLFLMMVLITMNSFSRYILNNPFPGVVQTVELYLMPITVFFTAASLQKQNGNIRVTFIRSRVSDLTDAILRLLYRIPTLIVFGILTLLAFDESASRIVARSRTTGVVEFPIYISWSIVLIGLVFLCIRLFIQILTDMRYIIND